MSNIVTRKAGDFIRVGSTESKDCRPQQTEPQQTTGCFIIFITIFRLFGIVEHNLIVIS